MTFHQPASRRLPIGDGLELSYAAQGNAGGTPLILLHGYTDSWRSYGPLMAELPASLRVIAVSQRGHGDSSKPETYAVGDFAADVAALCDRLDIDNAVVVGHSMGSLVASRFAIDHPDRVAGLVLIGAFKCGSGNPAIAGLWRDVAALTDPVNERFVHEFQASTLARSVSPAFLTTVIAESLKVPARVWRGALRPLMETDFSGELNRVRARAVVIWGADDPLTDRAEQQTLASLIGGRLIVHQGIGHSPHWEDPQRVAAEVMAFVSELAHTGA